MADLRTDLLTGVGSILTRSHITAMCEVCHALIGHEVHTCDPEQATVNVMAHGGRYLLGDHPWKRAKSYQVE